MPDNMLLSNNIGKTIIEYFFQLVAVFMIYNIVLYNSFIVYYLTFLNRFIAEILVFIFLNLISIFISLMSENFTSEKSNLLFHDMLKTIIFGTLILCSSYYLSSNPGSTLSISTLIKNTEPLVYPLVIISSFGIPKIFKNLKGIETQFKSSSYIFSSFFSIATGIILFSFIALLELKGLLYEKSFSLGQFSTNLYHLYLLFLCYTLFIFPLKASYRILFTHLFQKKGLNTATMLSILVLSLVNLNILTNLFIF